MSNLNPQLLLSNGFYENLHSSFINGTNARGVYSPMQFTLRLRNDVQNEINSITPGFYSPNELSENQTQAFSTYLHETIHWWQHVGSNYGLISSLKYPAQSHINHSYLKSILTDIGPIKSIAKYDIQNPNSNLNINKTLNYWHDIDFANKIAFAPNNLKTITNNPYFESWGHSYQIMWGSSIWTLISTVDNNFSFLPNIREWEAEFEKLRKQKIKGFYHGSPNTIAPIGTKSIFEGQARFSQIQYLARGKNYTVADFEKLNMLEGIYVECFDLFLKILGEKRPLNAVHPLIGLFLLVCDLSINPTNGFPFEIRNYESFIISNDPGYRFILLCQQIRDHYSVLKIAIKDYSKEEYITISNILASSIETRSPHESAGFICRWLTSEQTIQDLLKEEETYRFKSENLPIRLFFSKFLRFQEDKYKYPHIFCWPGINLTETGRNELQLAFDLFEKHKALFIDGIDGDIYHSAMKGYTDEQVDSTLNGFFAWNSVYDLTRQWIVEPGPFNFKYEWLSSKYSADEMQNWASTNFEISFGIRPENFKII
ncbi:hypothetical protein [Mucilaginibacter celer]|nr:hypothetical protein [Mucilaginibacter celer]